MGIENIYVSQHLNVGPRYIFFKSLDSAQPNQFYSKILSIGQNYVSQATNILSPKSLKEESNEKNLERISLYINFIKEVANNERNNEYNFIKKIKEYSKQDELLFKDINSFLDTSNVENGSEFNYLQLINLINRIMKTNDELDEKRDEKILTNMQLISENLGELTKAFPELKNEIQELFEINYNAYRQSIASLIPNSTYEDNINSINEFLANKINTTLEALSTSTKFENLVAQQVTSNGWDIEEIYNSIYAIVVEKISKMNYDTLINSSAKNIAQDIINNFDILLSNITENMADNAKGLFSKKSLKAPKKIEVVAMTTRKGLADLFKDLSEADRQNFFELDQNLASLFKDVENSDTISAKSRFTQALGNAIRNKFKAKGFKTSSTDKNQIEKEVLAFMDKHPKLFKRYDYKDEFKSNINVKTTGSTLAEYLTSHSKILTNAIIHGNATKFKTDLSITMTFGDFNNITFLNKTDKQQLLLQLKNFMPTMLEKYKQINKERGNALEQTDVVSAEEAYKQTMKDIYQTLQKIKIANDSQGKKRQQLIDTISNFILNSISVKDYTFYANQLGFHGGSLGGGSSPENVLDNIQKMYELGGISPKDRDLLLFAILNCSPATIGYNLKEDLATYLLGGAAMIMFDDGFTAANKFLEDIKKEFGFNMAPLHLYRLNGKFIPASYIYSSIYNNLLNVYQDLTQETTIKNVQSYGNKVVITNNITENIIQQKVPYDVFLQERWDIVANEAPSEVSITFTFMAGLLDIFEAIPKAFNQIK